MFALRNQNGQLMYLCAYAEQEYDYYTIHYELMATTDSRFLFVVPSEQVWADMVEAYQEMRNRAAAHRFSWDYSHEVTVASGLTYTYESEYLPELMQADILQLDQWTLVPLNLEGANHAD